MSQKIIASTIDKTGKNYIGHNIVKEGECQFPFIHKGKLYKECVPGQKGKWCATELDKDKKMVKMGFCPIEKKISIKRNTVKSNVKKNNSVKKNNAVKKNSVKKNTSAKKTITIKKSMKEPDSLNQLPVNVPIGMEKYVRPENDSLKISHWENPNRKKFIRWFDTTFKKYKIKERKPALQCDLEDEECHKSTKPKKRDLFPTQKIVRDYLSVNSPYRGLLLYHGLGVGKTCASIAITESNKEERKVVVLLQKSIKQNYIQQLMECGDEYFKLNQHWVYVPCSPIKDRPTYLFALKTGITRAAINANKGAFFIDFTKKDNFSSFSSEDKEKIKLQIMKMIDSKYEFKHTNGLTAAQLDKMELERYFDDKIVVIDEVHNVINGMAGGGSMRATRLNELFMNAHNVRFVFLSGTPMKNIPFEVAKIFNVLRGYITNYVLTLAPGKGRTRMEWDELEEELYEHPLIDQVIIDGRSKEVKFSRNPYGFINHENGLVRSELNNISDSQFIEQVSTYIKERLNYKIIYVNSEVTTTFPDDNKEFMNMFYDVDKNDIKDKELFKRRTIGMVSYVASADQDLVPEIRIKEILEIPMSDYMFNKYAAVRKSEIEKDSNSKEKKKPGLSIGKKNKDVSGDIFKVNSSYRAYSRMLCQFVFPETIERPFKGDLKDIEFDDDSEISQKIVELNNDYEEKIMKAKKTTDKDRLRGELVHKIREVKGKSKEYEKRLYSALKELDKHREEYLAFDNGNPEKLSKYSPKYAKIIERLLRDRGTSQKGLKFIYTEYKTCEGVGILSLVLKANGYSPFKVKKDSTGDWVLDFDPKTDTKPKYAVWSGDEESDIILNIYNDKLNNLPDKLRRQVEAINTSNQRGQLLEILMTTKQGAEGLNTRNVRQLHVVEPYWNPVRLDQVIGRAVRTNSHIELPKKERNVDIYIYLSKATQAQLRSDITIMNDFTGKTSDQVLYNIAERKRHIMDIVLGIIKDGAIDCYLNLNDNKKNNKGIKCVNFGDIKTRKSFSHTANIRDEIKEKERRTRVQTKKIGFTTIEGKNGKKYAKKGNYIYDYEASKADRPGDPIGEIITKGGKKTVKMYK
tara:strand:+ start:3606 stop:6857 length:3252 start_codon:yes stop_codon:yes gene_type:complete